MGACASFDARTGVVVVVLRGDLRDVARGREVVAAASRGRRALWSVDREQRRFVAREVAQRRGAIAGRPRTRVVTQRAAVTFWTHTSKTSQREGAGMRWG